MRKWVERVRGSSVNMSGLGCLFGSPSEVLRRPSSTQSWASREGSQLEMQSCEDYSNAFLVRFILRMSKRAGVTFSDKGTGTFLVMTTTSSSLILPILSKLSNT